MTPAVGLSRGTFAKVSPHPYLLANLDPPGGTTHAPSRSNGRSPNQVRTPSVNLASLSHAHGSAVVRMGDTTVICGVRGETILTPQIPNHRADNQETELKDYDLLVPNIELATGSAPQFMPGGPPTTLAQTLSTRVYSLLHRSRILDPDDLRIWYDRPSDAIPLDDDAMKEDQPTERVVVAYWVLYIDIFFISFDGNPFDAAWAATLAALKDTKIPQAWFDPDKEAIICSRANPKPLSISGNPIACTAVVFTGKETDRPTEGRYWLLVDPDASEESLCDESLTIVVECTDDITKFVSVSKHGGTNLSSKILTSKDMLQWTSTRWKGFVDAIAGQS